jgi:catechol 2,3-dioxygenase-like lactoylglutathione lyase family enzyme
VGVRYDSCMSTRTPAPSGPENPRPVNRVVPFAYVADVERSIAFYELLGFLARRIERGAGGRVEWVWLESPETGPGGPAALMLGLSSLPIATVAQGIFFCMHCADARAMRSHLLAHGLRDGGVRTGSPGADREPSAVFTMVYPAYMPGGEFHVHDPDGYTILIGQPAPAE